LVQIQAGNNLKTAESRKPQSGIKVFGATEDGDTAMFLGFTLLVGVKSVFFVKAHYK